MGIDREDIEKIAKASADEVMTRLGEPWPTICECITEYSLALAASEALEHNAMIGGHFRKIGQMLKEILTEEQYEGLLAEYEWFEAPITEFTAEIYGAAAIRQVGEKCHVDVSEVLENFNKGLEWNRLKEAGTAQLRFMNVKQQLAYLAEKLCGKELAAHGIEA